MSERPDVSVLMAVYNGVENYPTHCALGAAILRSLYEQAGVTVEVCAVDDASTDASWSTLQTFADLCNVKIARHATNRGPAAAYQTAAEMATGRYIILQSVRSWYEPGAFALMVNALDENPDIGFVYGKTQYHGAREDTYTPPPFVRSRFWHSFDSLFGYMYRREALDAGCEYVGYLQRDGRPVDVADYDFVMQLVVKMGWRGLALRDALCLHYWYSGEGQQTNLVHEYQAEIDHIFAERWGHSG